jgi:hypothetical protein
MRSFALQAPWRSGVLLMLTVAAAPIHPVAAQDSHYWTYQFGDRATLLGGMVVGGVVDLSAVYYNPGALSLLEDPGLFAATKTFEMSRIGITAVPRELLDLGEDRLGVAPSFFAGLVPFRFLGNQKLGYSLFTRQKFRARINGSQVGQEDLLPLQPGTEDFLASVRLDSELSESWGGLTWSLPLGRSVGVGISQFLAGRSQRAWTRSLAEVFDTSGVAVAALQEDAYEYFSYRMLWKVGLSAEWLGASLGLTVTTPSVRLFGSGKFETNATAISTAADPGDYVFIADYQDNLAATYRSPLSVAAGAAYRIAGTRLYATAEWFQGEEEFAIMDLAPFVGQSTGDTVVPQVTQEMRSVLNFGFGVEHRLGPTTTGYASFRTDLSAATPGAETDVSVSSWDIHFFTLGASFRLANSDFTLGAGYGFGQQSIPQAPPGGDGGLLPESLEVDYRNYRLFFAFGF